MSTEAIWFFERAGERHGPVASAEILRLASLGEIGPDNLVWREGLAGWIPLSESGLAPSGGLRPAPPSLPVLSAAPPPVPKSAVPYVPREARLRPGYRPRIRDSYGRAWELMATRFWPFVGVYALASLILGVASQFYFPIFFLMYPIMGGLYWYNLQCIRKKEVTLEALFEGFRRQFGPLAILNLIVSLIATVVTVVLIGLIVVGAVALSESPLGSHAEDPLVIGVIVLVGFIALMVFLLPLMILGIVGNFGTLLILDCELKAGEALSLAWRATKPHLFKLTLFMLLNGVLSMAGLVALYVGVFITGTWATIAAVYLYEDAFGDDPPQGGTA